MSTEPSLYEYDRADAPADALRLHLNENTGGCSPAVMPRVAAVTARELAQYPDYAAMTRTVARHLGVASEELLLTNGLDEGILAVAIAQLRGPTAEAVILEPAFGMYADSVDAVGGTVVRVMPAPDFAINRDAVVRAISARTGALFVASPGNPSGRSLTTDEIVWMAGLLPPDALLLLDEAYVEFAPETFLSQLPSHANVVVGRTFAKAYGLAGLRAGALIGRPDVIARLKRVIPPYSLNVFVVAALEAALVDRHFMEQYLRDVRESKRLFYAACDRWGLSYVPSDANFVLVRAGDRRQVLLDGLQARNIYIRDRDRQPGCAGCVRVTTGRVAHTQACIDAMEEILCGRV